MPVDSARLLAFLLNAFAQAAVVATGTAVALWAARTACARVKHRIAVVGLALSAAVPILSAWPSAGVHRVAVMTPVVGTSALGGRMATTLVYAYLALLLLKVAALAKAALTIVVLRRESTPITEGPIVAAYQRCGGSRRIRLCRSLRTTAPLVCGVARPAIVIPDGFADADRDLLDAVIAHECAHVSRHDVAVALAIEAVTLPLGPHPAIGALKRAAANYRELACDELAIASLRMRRTTYASVLVRMAEWHTAASAVAPGAAALLEARVRGLLDVRLTRPVGVAGQALVGLCLALATAAAPFCAVVIDVGWAEMSGVWTLDIDRSTPVGRLPFRAVRLRIDATRDRVHMAQQRTRTDGVDEAFDLARTADDVPAEVKGPGGMVVRTRARWVGNRLVTNSVAPGWREHVEAIADGNRLVITTENVTGMGRSRYEFVFRKE